MAVHTDYPSHESQCARYRVHWSLLPRPEARPLSARLLILLVFGIVAVVLVWKFFIAQLDKQMHQRRVEMIQKKIEKREHAAKENADDSR